MVPPVTTPAFANSTLEWNEAGWPRSTLYGDIYFSGADALGESTHVFLQGNRLQQRWRQLQADNFSIGELGFGSGLNFLNTCRLWCENAPVTATLHYLACELHPLTVNDVLRLHLHWPELRAFSTELLRYYPDHTAGVHQMELRFDKHRISLTLLYGDAEAMLAGLSGQSGFKIDAWYLDGFSPRLNPRLWRSPLLQTLALLSKPGTTLATYSVAGAVRRSLAEAGFNFEKVTGFASKRAMLTAEFPGTSSRAPTEAPQRHVCVIGGGLAGCSTAWALANSGWQVLLLEKEHAVATQGSGNPQGILHCNLSTVEGLSNQFNLHAWLHALRFYTALSAVADFDWHNCGMLQVAVTERLRRRYRQIAASGLYAEQVLQLLDAAAASVLAGIKLDQPALHFPGSGWLSPPRLCAAYLQHPAITLRTGTAVTELVEQAKGGWRLLCETGGRMHTLETGKVILCSSADIHRYRQTRHYPVISNRGQVDLYQATPATAVRKVLCGPGYILPTGPEQQSIGGSYFVGDQSPAATERRSKEHLRQLRQLNPQLAETLAQQTPLAQRLGTRCIMPDRMPLVGAACRTATEGGGEYEGLYLNVAHGSHGLTRTPLCAAIVASIFNGTPPPLGSDMAAILRPGRYSA